MRYRCRAQPLGCPNSPPGNHTSSMRHLVSIASAIALTAVLAACGSDDSSSAATTTSSPAAAVTAIDGTSAELDKASTALKDGDRAAAEEAVKEAYVSHFEDAEQALEVVDAELTEELEDGIGKDLLADFRSATDAGQLQATISALQAKLDEAKAKLQP